MWLGVALKGIVEGVRLHCHPPPSLPPSLNADEGSAELDLDAAITRIMEDVRLRYLVDREGEGGLDAVTNWDDVLSLGEQQRLGMVREGEEDGGGGGWISV